MNLLLKYALCFLVFFNGSSLLAQVGINTDTPKTMLDVKGNLALRAGALSLTNGNNDIVAGDQSLFNITGPTDNFKINTIQPQTDADGQIITLVNNTNFAMILAHNEGAGANSISCPRNENLVLKGIYTTATLQYNKTMQRWVVIKYADTEDSKMKIYSTSGTTLISTNSSEFSDMEDVLVEFTPERNIVYVNLSISGNIILENPNGLPKPAYGDFKLIKTIGNTDTEITGFSTLVSVVKPSSPTIAPWNVRMAMFPVSVTPGELTQFKVQWRRDGKNPVTLICGTETVPSKSHRSITVLD